MGYGKGSDKRDFGRGSGGGFRSSFGGNFGQREMHTATCTQCGGEAKVPFKPTPGKQVLCNTCFQAKKQQRSY